MRNKAFLPLMEQICMIAVFAIVSVLCIQGFSLAYNISYKQERKDGAVIAAQNTAEILKSTFGDLEKSVELYAGYYDSDTWYIPYDENWEPLQDAKQAEFLLLAEIREYENAFLGGADIKVLWGEEILFTMTVNWQEGWNERA